VTMGLSFILIWESVAQRCHHLRHLHPQYRHHLLQKLNVRNRGMFLTRM
jgi:hypothetical protein